VGCYHRDVKAGDDDSKGARVMTQKPENSTAEAESYHEDTRTQRLRTADFCILVSDI
jgi:hypothetical protein